MAEVRTTFTSDDKEVQKSLAAMQKQLQRVTEELRKAKDESKAVGESQEDAFGGAALNAVKSWAAGIVSATTVAAAFRAELEAIKKQQDEARKNQLSAASPERAFLLNYIPQSAGEAEAARGIVSDIAKRTGVSREDVYRVATPAVSATASEDQLWQATELALRVRPDDMSEASAIAGGLGDTAKLTGSGDMNANLGVILKLAKQARVQSLSAVSANLIPGAIGVKARGGSDAEATAAIAAFTKGSADATGAASGTSMIKLSNQLAEALPALGSFDERIRYMAANEDERTKFLKTASFEEKAKAPSESFLSGGSVYQNYLENLKGANSKEAFAQLGQQTIAAIDAQPLQQGEALNRGFEKTAARIGEQAFGDGSLASIREGIQKIRERTGVMGIEQMMGSMGGDVLESTIRGREGYIGAVAGQLENITAMQSDKEVVKELRALREQLLQQLNTTNENTAKRINVDGNAE